jgi:hypothetical protein
MRYSSGILFLVSKSQELSHILLRIEKINLILYIYVYIYTRHVKNSTGFISITNQFHKFSH